ncbi:hypothetical protein B1218_36820, partial [Pseudomonas ogarae]
MQSRDGQMAVNGLAARVGEWMMEMARVGRDEGGRVRRQCRAQERGRVGEYLGESGVLAGGTSEGAVGKRVRKRRF